MACNNIIAIPNGVCETNSAGITGTWLIDMDSITGTTIDVTAHTITNIATDGSLFEGFAFRRNTGSLVSTPAIDKINGSSFFNNVLSLVFHRRSASKSRALTVLGEGQRYLGAIVLDTNGLYTFVEYLQLDGGDETTGVARADKAGYDVNFGGESSTRNYFIDPSIVAALIN